MRGVGMILFGVATLFANWAVAHVYLMGAGGSRS